MRRKNKNNIINDLNYENDLLIEEIRKKDFEIEKIKNKIFNQNDKENL